MVPWLDGSLIPMTRLALPFPAFAALFVLGCPALRAQDGDAKSPEHPKVRFLAESILDGASQVAIWAGEKGVGPAIKLPRNYLAEAQPAPARSFLVVAAPGGVAPAAPKAGETVSPPPALAAVQLPAEGAGFVVILVPSSPKQYRPVVIRVDDKKFNAGDVYLHNQTTATILARIGRKQFEMGPGSGRIETPAPDGDKPYIDVAFGQRVENQTRVLNSTRWPLDNRNRSYVFFYFDEKNKRVSFRAVDEFVPPEEPKKANP